MHRLNSETENNLFTAGNALNDKPPSYDELFQKSDLGKI